MVLPQLAEASGAEVVAWNRDVEPYGRARDRRVAEALRAGGCKLLADWDQLLVPPDGLATGAGDPYRVYGPFFRSWRRRIEQAGPEACAPVALRRAFSISTRLPCPLSAAGSGIG